jgi:hypothetical protein
MEPKQKLRVKNVLLSDALDHMFVRGLVLVREKEKNRKIERDKERERESKTNKEREKQIKIDRETGTQRDLETER